MNCLSINDFDTLYKQYGPMVYRRCLFMLNNEMDAVDAMQDVFVKVIENKEKIKNVCSSFFYVIATRVCLNKIRGNKRQSNIDFDVVSGTIEDDLALKNNEKIDAEVFLDQLFEQRDQKDKLIATLHYVDGATLEETAESIHMSVAGVRKRLDNIKKFARNSIM